MTKEEALNVAGQCRATASHPLAYNISVDGGSGLLRELLIDAAKVIEALAQPEQEPFGYLSIGDSPIFQKEKPEIGRWETLYTALPQRSWVGLTDEELSEFDVDPIEAKLMIAKLKDKNT